MTSYNMFRALEVCMQKVSKQEFDGGVETCIMVASATNIPKEGPESPIVTENSIEVMTMWGSPNPAKCDFVRKYVRDHRGKKKSPTMAWDAEIALGDVEYVNGDKDSNGFVVTFGALADTTANGKAIIEELTKTFNAYKA